MLVFRSLHTMLHVFFWVRNNLHGHGQQEFLLYKNVYHSRPSQPEKKKWEKNRQPCLTFFAIFFSFGVTAWGLCPFIRTVAKELNPLN